jgi:ClpP class serine protease
MKPKNFSRADYIQALCGGDIWAISKDWAHTLANWSRLETFDPQSLVTQAGERFGSGMSRTNVRDGVGIMQIRGPLFTHENFLTWLFGFDTYESLAKDFQDLASDSNVKGIALNFHSPGGLTAGVDDLASMIYDARGLKPQGLVARAGGDMSSAAYWLGSSAETIHVASTGMVGSIGTVVQFTQEDPGTVTIVSDQSPMKRPDPATEEGRGEVKGLLNALSNVFISRVARNRGTTSENVMENFGKGGVKVGQEAVESGMADKVTTFETTFTVVRNPKQETSMSVPQAQAPAPAQTTQTPAPQAQAQSQSQSQSTSVPAQVAQTPAISAEDAVKAERERVSGILATFEGTPFASDATSFVASGKSVVEAQAYALQKLKTPGAMAPAPKALAMTTAQMTAEGSQAAAAAASQAPITRETQAKSIFSAMTQGANDFRTQATGAGANRKQPQ